MDQPTFGVPAPLYSEWNNELLPPDTVVGILPSSSCNQYETAVSYLHGAVCINALTLVHLPISRVGESSIAICAPEEISGTHGGQAWQAYT